MAESAISACQGKLAKQRGCTRVQRGVALPVRFFEEYYQIGRKGIGLAGNVGEFHAPGGILVVEKHGQIVLVGVGGGWRDQGFNPGFPGSQSDLLGYGETCFDQLLPGDSGLAQQGPIGQVYYAAEPQGDGGFHKSADYLRYGCCACAAP